MMKNNQFQLNKTMYNLVMKFVENLRGKRGAILFFETSIEKT